jgi:hypothetical protein
VVLRSFEYLNISERVAVLSDTIGIAAPDVASFFAMFSCTFSAFALLAMSLFGHSAESYSSFVKASESLFLWLLGDFDYQELLLASPLFAATFFVVYNIVTVFVLLNVFIGIIGEAYCEAVGDGEYAGTFADDIGIMCTGIAITAKETFGCSDDINDAPPPPEMSEDEGASLLAESKSAG